LGVASTFETSDAPIDGRRRVFIDAIFPEVDGGRHPIKRVLGDRITVMADLLVDGHDQVAGVLLYRTAGAPSWREEALRPQPPAQSPRSALAAQKSSAPAPAPAQPVEDRWCASFVVDTIGRWEYTISAWVDTWSTWVWGLRRKLEARQQVEIDLRSGAALVAAAAGRAGETDRAALQRLADGLSSVGDPLTRATLALDSETAALMSAHPDRSAATTHDPALSVTVDPVRAGFSSWYEMFPRSCGEAGRHGTLREAEQRLPYIAEMGFDIVYLPPIHPIGRTHRKGSDNSLTASPADPGSPWAVGGPEGGHLAIHPELGTREDFRHFLAAAHEQRLDVALDIALQASPDHPYVEQHPEWFVHRPDGSIQHAENPPKKYEDILPFDFAGPAWESLWREARGIFLHWIEEGVHVFRVDNPHTKPIPFWRWCIRTIKERHPQVIFLAEAFTRPKLMYALAKVGFSQSYTYFTWRTTKAELTEYMRSIVGSNVREYFRPNFWPNTPDILPEHLQLGTRATFIARAVLAATLSPNWGIYGPPYELQEKLARPGSEEYAGSEKYQFRSWDLARPDSLRHVLARLNQIRREHPALQRLEGVVFHETDNASLICYSRAVNDSTSEAADGTILVVVNLDPHNRHTGWLSLDLDVLSIADEGRYQVHDLMSDARYLWQGRRVFVALDPEVMPAHVFRIRRHIHTEQTFEYYL
jgi:starch synthase (maltosyl-transferring)